MSVATGELRKMKTFRTLRVVACTTFSARSVIIYGDELFCVVGPVALGFDSERMLHVLSSHTLGAVFESDILACSTRVDIG